MKTDKLNQEAVSSDRPMYEAPKARFMNEQEIFAALQTSVNATTWWNM